MTRGGDDGRELAVVRNEISMSEDLIKRRLVLAMVRAARDVHRGSRHGHPRPSQCNIRPGVVWSRLGRQYPRHRHGWMFSRYGFVQST